MRREAGEEKRRKEESKEEVNKKKRSREEATPKGNQREEAPQPNVHMAPPPAGARVKEEEDEWVVKGNKVICFHRKPRRTTFTPVNTRCPVDYTKLKSKRVTHCINLETGAIVECVDERRCTRPYYSPFEPESTNVTWTGWTEFEIEDERNLAAKEEPRGGAKRKA